MTIWILSLACGVLVLIAAVSLFRLAMVGRQLRIMREELSLTQDKSYNRQISVQLIDEDVTELAVQLNKNLDYQKSLKLKSEQSERMMKQSVSDIAHDLRTPLTVIKGNLQMLESSESLSEKGREYVRISSEKADAIRQMADEFFELSVLESDSSSAQLTRTDLTAALVDFIIDSEAVIRCKGIEPEINLPEKSIFAMADEAMLQRMLSNMLSNTLKHGGGSFALSLSEEDGGCSIRFENTLKPDEHPDPSQLFRRTYRGDKAHGGSGAGLGLYIVKLLADKQNAAASAEIIGGRLAVSITFRTEG